MPRSRAGEESRLPMNLEAERFVLGALLVDPQAFVKIAPLLNAQDFALQKHKLIFRRLSELADRQEPLDRTTLANELIKREELQSVDGLSYLVSLDDGLPTIENISAYTRIVKEKARLRAVMSKCQHALDAAANEEMTSDEIAGSLASKMIDIAKGSSEDTGLQGLGQIIAETGTNVLIDPNSRAQGLKTGFHAIDELTGGFREGELIILAARPAMGKTAFALNIGENVACHPQFPRAVAVFSLEMSKESLLTRMLCARARVDAHKHRAGFLNAVERRRMQEAMSDLNEAPIFIDDSSSIGLLDIQANVQRLQRENDVGLVIVDYLQLMSGSGRENRQQDVSGLSRGFKLLSKELKVPFLVLSQLSRAPDQRQGDHRPQLSDLRESGCLSGSTLIADANTGQRIPIQDVQPGMAVWALNENTFKAEPATVSRAFCTGTKRVFTLKTGLGRTIEATANHKFRTWDGWKALADIRRGERIAIPRAITPQGHAATDHRSEDLALLGHMIGNGCMLPSHVIQFTSGSREISEIVASLASQCFGPDVQPRVSPERSWFQVYLASTRRHTHGVHSAVRDWLDSFGLFGMRSHEKFVPDAVFRQSAAGISTFLRHLWSSDGCINMSKDDRRTTIYYATCSPRLGADVQSLLLRLGINARKSTTPQMAKGRQIVRVEITGKPDMLRFCHVVGAVGKAQTDELNSIRELLDTKTENTNRDIIPHNIWRDFAVPAMERGGITTRQMIARLATAYCGTSIYKQNVSRLRALKLAAAVQCESIRILAESDVYWDRVVSVEYAGEKPVYDLTVPGHHNFVADDIIAHNSIEQDADTVMFVFREEVYRPDKESLRGLAEIILGKQRHGPTGTRKLAFLGKYTRFETLASDAEAQLDTSPPDKPWSPGGTGIFAVPDQESEDWGMPQ